MAKLVLGSFCAGLFVCVAAGFSTLYALSFGLLVFMLYGRYKGFSWGELIRTAAEGVLTAKNVLVTFILIGVLTALWRMAGTLPAIVCYASVLIRPSILLLMTFLLNCLVSMLTGSSFGTAATMGVICGTIGTAMNVNICLVGGAVLSGVYFGDRCSPVSTSALLVAELTGTQVVDNIRDMMKSAAIPFAVSCMIYLGLGLAAGSTGNMPDLVTVFENEFNITPVCILPAAVIFVLAMMRMNVKIAMLSSIVTAIPVALFVQNANPAAAAAMCLTGYRAETLEVAWMLNGGGITSMLKVTGIVGIASSYSGIFKKTELLEGLQRQVEKFAEKTNPYTALLLTGFISSMIACNQSLAVMLTAQFGEGLEKDPSKLALDLEDTVVITAPLIPWNIAGAVPLASVGAPLASIPLAVYLYLLPLWRLAGEGICRREQVRCLT